MIPGYNHNLDYAGKLFHVQTEDSGPNSYTITTELFIGGNLLENRKHIYHEGTNAPPPETDIRTQMQEQHKGMMRDLINGVFDDVIDQRAPLANQLEGPTPINIPTPETSVAISTPIHHAQEKTSPRKSEVNSSSNPDESLRDFVLRYLSDHD
tara:strand:- start:61 stop:519 length:459 start_codon:yes stop_codon:yes gene_type:complete